jgi:S1-C subfamily serine protease
MATSLDPNSNGTLSAVLKRTTIGAALVLGLAGGAVGTAMIDGAQAQSTTDTTTTQQSQSDQTVADVAAAVNPAVVTVTNLQKPVNPNTGQPETGQDMPVGSGSGFIISEEGYVVTNNHVTEGGDEFTVTYMDGTVVPATFVGSDSLQDVAVLKLDLSGGENVPATVKIGDSSALRSGDTVIAIGSPYGELTNTVTTGTVNAMDRSLDTGQGYDLPNLIQHDANIYPGNSGGPLVNLQGEVVGINVAKAFSSGTTGADGIGFAIESNAAKDIVTQIVDTGSYARAYLGISAQPIVGQDGQSIAGEGVMEVTAGTPAEEAGLQAGDVITAVDGVTIDGDHQFINEAIMNHKPGDTVTLTIDRNGQSQDITVTLGTRPADLTQG